MKNSKMVKRIATLLTAVLLVASMSVTAFAEDGSSFTGSNGVVSNVTGNTITLRKDIVIHGSGGAAVYSPDVTYSYTIAPATVTNATVTDKDNNSIAVKSGNEDGVSLTDSNAAFTSESVTLTDGKGTVSDDITVTVTPANFPAAGVYRYVITEQDNTATLTEQGITRPSGYIDKRYLDVYIANNADGSLKISGYVLFVASEADADTVITSTGTAKTEGFVDTTTTSGTTDAFLADQYYTYDLTVKTVITGDLADKTHEFPFVVNTSGVAGRTVNYTVTKSGTSTNETGTVGTNISANLADGDTLTIYGLPANTKFNVQETNNTADTYKVKVDETTPTETSLKAEQSLAANGIIKAFDTDAAISDYTAYNGKAAPTASYQAIQFTNNLAAVSPTGVILRVAPYAILLGAAVVLGIFYLNSRKKKSSKNVL